MAFFGISNMIYDSAHATSNQLKCAIFYTITQNMLYLNYFWNYITIMSNGTTYTLI